MVVLADGLDGHVAGVDVLLLRRHRELWLVVTRAAVLAGKGEQIVGGAADVMIRVRIVLAALLLLQLEFVVVVHSCGCSFGLRGGCAGRVVLVVVRLRSRTQGSGLEVAGAGSDAGALEVEDCLRVRAGGGEHGTAAARSEACAQGGLVGRGEASEAFAEVVALARGTAQHSRAQWALAQRVAQLPARGNAG